MTRLTKIEKETIILFNEGESTASIYTYNVGLKKRLAAFSKKYPDLCCLEKPEHLGGVSYLIDKSGCPSACSRHTARSAGRKPVSTPGKMVSTAIQSNASIRGDLRPECRVCIRCSDRNICGGNASKAI
jgi:hypothetical protein